MCTLINLGFIISKSKSRVIKVFFKSFLESYREDYNEAKEFFHDAKAEEQQFYINMKSGAESGWDYSTKWYAF